MPLDLDIQLILFLQSLGDWLQGPMQVLSLLGNEEFFLLIMPILFWSVDAGLGLRVGLILMTSAWTNGVIKILLHGPRPYFYDARVRALSSETSFGPPSGHAQNAAAVWGLMAAWNGTRAGWVLAVVLTFLIGLSRAYLGVHFFSDVVFGWVLGAALVWAFRRFERPVVGWLRSLSLNSLLLFLLVVSVGMVLVPAAATASLGAWTLPADWAANILQDLPEDPLPEPLALSGLVTLAGAFFGLSAGAVFLQRRGWYDAGGSLALRSLRYPIGLAGVVLLWFGLGAILPRGENFLPYIYRFVRYALVGGWITFGAPLVFMRFGLAQGRQAKQSAVAADF